MQAFEAHEATNMDNDDCVFCNIATHTVPAKVYFEDDDVLAIQDILPKAPVHVLVITRKHIPSVVDLTDADQMLVGKMVLTAQRVAKQLGVEQTGYRLSYNVGKNGRMIVPHLHLHVLGGMELAE